MGIEPALIGAAAGVTSAAITLAGFWLALGGRIGKAERVAEDALQTAAEATEDLKETNVSLAALSANFGLYRESAIEKFVTREVIGEVEKRLIESNTRSEERLTEAIKGMNRRLDRLLEGGLHRTED